MTHIADILFPILFILVGFIIFVLAPLMFRLLGMPIELTAKNCYECIENELYLVNSEKLIKQNKKCKLYDEEIYIVKENGDLIKIEKENL